MTKATELRTKDVAALEKEVTDLLKAHFGLRMQKATQQLTNHSQLGKTRRDIARAKTVLAQKKKDTDATGEELGRFSSGRMKLTIKLDQLIWQML